MALSRKAWIAGGMGARLLMIAVLAVSVPLTVHNHTKRDYDTDFYKLQSYSYVPSPLAVSRITPTFVRSVCVDAETYGFIFYLI
jgi:hypothetical protein